MKRGPYICKSNENDEARNSEGGGRALELHVKRGKGWKLTAVQD